MIVSDENGVSVKLVIVGYQVHRNVRGSAS